MSKYPAYKNSGLTPVEFMRDLMEKDAALEEACRLAEGLILKQETLKTEEFLPEGGKSNLVHMGSEKILLPKWLLVQDAPAMLIMAKLIGDVDLLVACREMVIREIAQLQDHELGEPELTGNSKRIWQSIVPQSALNALEGHVDAAIMKAQYVGYELPQTMRALSVGIKSKPNDGITDITPKER